MREDLLGYLLGALDASERDHVQTQLDNDPLLRDELELLRARLESIDDEPYEPPADLAGRTSRLVASLPLDSLKPSPAGAEANVDSPPVHTAVSRPLEPASSSSLSRERWRMADMIVASGIFLAASLLFFPAIANSRFTAQVQHCQANMHRVGLALQEYANIHTGWFPSVDLDQPYSAAGIYAPLLVDGGYVQEPQYFICPSAAQLEQWTEWQPPTLDELKAAKGPAVADLRSRMGGTYGFQLGYMRDRSYQLPRNRLRANFAIMADQPGRTADLQSFNHGGRGQNVLFEDGHVEFMREIRPVGMRDDFFRSDRGIVEPGRHVHDAVIARSGVSLTNFSD